jgi:hypothetical protein
MKAGGIRDIEEVVCQRSDAPGVNPRRVRRQTEVAIANLDRLYAAVGDRIAIIRRTGGLRRKTDVLARTYRALYLLTSNG